MTSYRLNNKKKIQEGIQIAVKYMRTTSKSEHEEALVLLKKEGMKVSELSQEVKEQIKVKVKPVVEKHANEINIKLYNQLVEEVKKYSK